MPHKCLLSVVVVASIWLTPGRGAEPGNVDGDGRLTIGDVIADIDGKEAAPGAWERFGRCFGTDWERDYMRGSMFLESLRRGVKGSLDHWFGVWSPEATQELLPVSSRARVEFLPMRSEGGPDPRIGIAFVLRSEEPVRAFSLVLETEGNLLQLQLPDVLLGSPGLYVTEHHWLDFFARGGYFGYFSAEQVLFASLGGYLVTGGKFVVHYNVENGRQKSLQGEREMRLVARLPRGARAGNHTVRLHPSSQVLFDDGTVVSPASGEEGVLSITNDVTEGFDETIPPLAFSPDGHVRGKVQFRFADEAGNPARPGEPLVSRRPGEDFTLRVQMRTEVPLNQIAYTVAWPGDLIICVGQQARSVFIDPEDGLQHEFCTNFSRCAWAYLDDAFTLAGGGAGYQGPHWMETPSPVPALERVDRPCRIHAPYRTRGRGWREEASFKAFARV